MHTKSCLEPSRHMASNGRDTGWNQREPYSSFASIAVAVILFTAEDILSVAFVWRRLFFPLDLTGQA